MVDSEHVNVADTYKNLGAVHNYLGLIQEAIECYDHALAIYVKTFGLEDDQVRFVQDVLARLQQERGRTNSLGPFCKKKIFL